MENEELKLDNFNEEAHADLGKNPFAVLWEEDEGKSILQEFLPWIVIIGFVILAILIISHK